MKHKTSKFNIFIIIFVLFALILGIIFNIINKFEKKDHIINRYTYSDSSLLIDPDLIPKQEKDAVYNYLSNLYEEYNGQAGFYRHIDYDSTKFQQLYSCLKIAEINGNGKIPKETFSKIYNLFQEKEQSMYYSTTNIEEYFYYTCIKKILDNEIDYDELYDKIDSYVDNETGLIYPISSDGDLYFSLLTTSNIIELANENDINIEKYNLFSKIDGVFDNFNFLLPDQEESFYNAGGIVLFALRDAINTEKYAKTLKSWYDKWEVKAAEYLTDNDPMWALIDYYSYYNIAKLFENKTIDETDKFIKKLKFSDVKAFEDNVLCNIYTYIYREHFDSCDKEFITSTEEYVQSYLDKENSSNEDVPVFDLGEQFYSQYLAYASGFEFDHAKFSATVENRYEHFLTDNDIEAKDLIMNTYYYLMLKETSSIDNSGFDKKRIIKKVDDALKTLLSEKRPDIQTISTALEIKSNISPDIPVSEKEKTVDIIKSYIENNVVDMNSVYIRKIDYILNTNIASDSWLKEELSALSKDGGYKCTVDDTPDLRSMYCVYSFNSSVNIFPVNDDTIKDVRNYAKEFKFNELYRYRKESYRIDTRSIYYGLALSTFN